MDKNDDSDSSTEDVRIFAAAVSDAIMGRQSTWDRIYEKTERMPLTDTDRQAFALMTGLDGEELEEWIDQAYPLAPKLWRKPSE